MRETTRNDCNAGQHSFPFNLIFRSNTRFNFLIQPSLFPYPAVHCSPTRVSSENLHPERISNLNPPSRPSAFSSLNLRIEARFFHPTFFFSKLVHASFDFGDKIRRQAVFDENPVPLFIVGELVFARFARRVSGVATS